MARFKFQLEAVLRQRTHVERQRQRDVAVVLAQMNALQDELRDLDRTVRQSTDELRVNHLVGPINMEYITAHRRFVLGTQRKALAIMQKMALVQKQLDAARMALAEAAKQRKIIEKLKERYFERWRAALSAREMAEMDEIGMQMSYQRDFAEADHG